MIVFFLFLFFSPDFSEAQLLGNLPFIQTEFQRAFTAYGPGLGVFGPYSYVDLFYDNIPFIGKIPVIGKDGTSSRTGISPFYPVGGNPSNPFPPLYKARPLPIHVPDPVEVVAVPLDEEALHGEKLFPDELVLPWLRETAADPNEKKKKITEDGEQAPNPFGEDAGVEEFSESKEQADSVSGACATCTDFGHCVLTVNSTCEQCVCPNGFEGECCEIDAPPTTCDLNPCGSDANRHFNCDNLPHGLYLCSCQPGWKGSNCDQGIDPCNPNPCYNDGYCQVVDGHYQCHCSDWYTGDICEVRKECISNPNNDACDCPDDPCSNNATCIEHKYSPPYECKCISQNFTGSKCENEPCNPSPCQHGGHCYTKSDGGRECRCLSIWTGWYCEQFNICGGGTACMNGGTCVPSPDGNNKTCNCVPGWEGDVCQNMTDNCDPNPCQGNSTCTNLFNDYSCECIVGLQGKSCEQNPNNCDIGGGVNPCRTMDTNAECVDGLANYTCVCSPDYTDTHCNMSIIVYNILIAGGGGLSIIDLLEEVVETPSLIKDLIPFMLGQMPQENQSAMSWDAEDLFVWAAYERTELNVSIDIHKWFDITLGNCFTFNHMEAMKSYGLRYVGDNYGFKTLMRVRQDEYLAWIDTASLLVFIHPSDETVFAESIRYQAAPSRSIQVITSKVSYQRLNGKYGACVNNVDEVDSYYYTGNYTTAGCLRSCYQDAVEKACGCMDPRYAVREGATPCGVNKWNCVQNVTEVRGDSSNWPECSCPSPCRESQFQSDYALSQFVSESVDCDPASPLYDECRNAVDDMTLITVMMPRISQQVFVESPKMTFNQLISYGGGMLGMFIGVCIITFIDFAFLFVLLARSCCSKDNGKSYYGRD